MKRGGFAIAAITASNVFRRTARALALAVPGRCSPSGVLRRADCTVRGFHCLIVRAGKELFFARCSQAARGQVLHRVVRFEHGS